MSEDNMEAIEVLRSRNNLSDDARFEEFSERVTKELKQNLTRFLKREAVNRLEAKCSTQADMADVLMIHRSGVSKLVNGETISAEHLNWLICQDREAIGEIFELAIHKAHARTIEFAAKWLGLRLGALPDEHFAQLKAAFQPPLNGQKLSVAAAKWIDLFCLCSCIFPEGVS